ncbi:CHAD domain-containing protein [Bradyrhizobium erythrophlei]|jgi:CHAD domain-containing protein|uniref:CHAD domain-containing protein n=2 Tax=Bradyrhizobium erythrophlei TaxID=1437360 RepID=A0A1M7UGG7_9BRAD|nr:CHAD domain-containing protein [Bradyrhizobium erythrophlei]
MKPPVNVKTSIKQPPPLTTSMTCEAAFRAAAAHYLQQLTARHEGTAAGDPAALHAMRVAMTRLRTTIALFSPMVEGDEQIRLAAELKWLRAHLGIVRDLDVALDRLAKIKPKGAVKGTVKGSINDRPWKQERAACQRHLTRALRSPRYRQLIKDITAWIESGDWSRKRNKMAVAQRTRPAGEYCADTLQAWRKKLLKKSRNLEELGTRKRHRVRLANKRLSYAIEAAEQLAPPDEAPARETMLKLLRTTQKSLGQLNDDARRRALAAAFGEDQMNRSDLLLDGKQKKRLLGKAVKAYDGLGRLEPLKVG